MANEKTPTLFLDKVPFEYEKKKSKTCTKSTLSWIFASLLVALFLVLVSIEFLYPAFQKKTEQELDQFEIVQEQYIPGKEKPPVATDYISEEMRKASEKNPWDLEFLLSPSQLCATRFPPNSKRYQRDPEIKLLMLVLSATCHFQQRNAIRNTWGSIAENPEGPMRLGFVLGTTKNKTEDNLVKEESQFYKDIIQVDFEDTLYQLTTKSVLMLKWVATNCAHAQYFLKADDDTFVNVGILANILGNEPFTTANKFIGGYVHTVLPTRIPERNDYGTEKIFPIDEYPSYASGSAYVTTGPTAVELFEASKEVQPFLPLEDVFITGLCGKHIDATLLHEPRFSFDDPPNPPSWQAFSNLATARSMTPDIMEFVWNDMTRSVLENLLNEQSDMDITVMSRK